MDFVDRKTLEQKRDKSMKKAKGQFELEIVDRISKLPTHRIGYILLRVLGRLIARFDEKGQTTISKDELISMLKESTEHFEDGFNLMKYKK